MPTFLRIIGDIHGQIDKDNLLSRVARPYLELISDVSHSGQVGDMGDDETYRTLVKSVDPTRHRFLRGNHEKHTQVPPHALGDFGLMSLNGVEFFFARGAASSDRQKLIEIGTRLGKTLWFPEEELTDAEMSAAHSNHSRRANRHCQSDSQRSGSEATPHNTRRRCFTHQRISTIAL